MEQTVELGMGQFIAIISFLVVNTASIVGAYYKFGNRLGTLEAKCAIIEKEMIPTKLNEMERKAAMEARTRQLECAAITGREISNLRDEVKEIKAMLKEHLAVSDERNKRNII